jgi:hypothetical protein
MAGLIGHPTKSVDLYTLAGTEQLGRSTFTTGTGSKTVGLGYGTGLVNDTGCDIELDPSSDCAAQTRAIDAITAGAWWRFLHGGYGTLQAGAEYTYIKRIAFAGMGGRPSTDDNLLFFSLRYLPFQ